MKRSSVLLLAALLAGCDNRDRLAQVDTAITHPAPVVPARSAYLTVSDLTPEPGGIIVVAGALDVGGDLSLGSFRVRLGYDSTKLRFIEEVPTAGMMRVVNPRAGDVIVVGASSGQPAGGTLFVLRFHVDDPVGVNSLVLRIDEINDAEFRDRKETITLASKLVLDSALAGKAIPTSTSGAPPASNQRIGSARPGVITTTLVIDSISPRSGTLDNERVTDLTLYGTGFVAQGNLVFFGDREIPGLMSENGGTVIRFPAPVIRASEGRIPVRVKRDDAESNVVFFMVKGGR